MTLLFTVATSLSILFAQCIASDDLGACGQHEVVDEDETSLLQTAKLQKLDKQGEPPMCEGENCEAGTGGPAAGGAGPGLDINGNPCGSCHKPFPGRGYDGVGIRSSELPADVDLAKMHAAGNYVVRDDCGKHLFSATGMDTVPISDFTFNTSTSWGANAFPGYQDAWCEMNYGVFSANGFANRDPLFEGKSLNRPPQYSFDFHYCKSNGWLSKEARKAVAAGFDAASAYATKFCAEKAVQFGHGFMENIDFKAFNAVYNKGWTRSPPHPTKHEAEYIGAWACAMGGTNGMKGGQSNGCLEDYGYCTYTYGDLGDGKWCQYDECAGWNPKTGMPVADMAWRATNAPTDALDYRRSRR